MPPLSEPRLEPDAAASTARARPFRGGQVYRGLPRFVRVGLWAATAVILGMVIGATFPVAMHLIGDTAALAPGRLAWYGVRTTGFLAYFAVAGSVVYGLLLSTRLLDAIAQRPVSFALHKDLALVGLVLSGLHGFLLLGDATYAFTPAAIAIPLASPYAPVGVGVGQLAFYVLILVTASFYVRRRIGQRSWRLIHYLTFLGFFGVTAHGLASGSDTAAPWAFWSYLLPVSAIVFLFVYRLVTAVAVRREQTHALHAAPNDGRRASSSTPTDPSTVRLASAAPRRVEHRR